MPSKIKSGERRRRRRQSLNLSAARGQPVILIKPDQDARGGDRRKPDRRPQPEGGEEKRQKDDCAKNSGHMGLRIADCGLRIEEISTITFSTICDFRLPIEAQKIRNPQSAIKKR